MPDSLKTPTDVQREPSFGAGDGANARSRFRPGPILRKATKAALLPPGVLGRRRPGDLVILLYHRVGVGRSEIDLDAAAFERQVAHLAATDPPRTLDEALAPGSTGGVVVTFDDGLGDFHRHVLPVLVRHRVPAVLYQATSLVDAGREDGLTWSQLREAADTGLVTIGAHTHGHTDLSAASEAEAEDEMRRSKDLVEDQVGVPCRHFAYPWAVGSPAADRTARRLFDSAALDAWRTNRRGRVDPHRLGRVPVLRSDGQVFFRAKVRGMLDTEALAYRALGRGPWGRP
jgi:peptidoglycan/xylan/chitin deacetylase (PgdA/CDA1 family)